MGVRHEFSAKVRAEAFRRSGGRCETCGFLLRVGHFDFDHRIANGLGGLPTLDNCVVCCRGCHGTKTYTSDIPAIARAKRRVMKAAGIRTKRRTIRAWRKFDGTIVRADD
jgi:5-methylcytosine-specific restriction protein A